MRLCLTSVQYGDHLRPTLPLWVALVGAEHITVVTSTEDTETQNIARANGVRCYITDAWNRKDPTAKRDLSHWYSYWHRRGVDYWVRPVFNKALALDEAFGFIPSRTPPPQDGEVCIVADADCRPVGELPAEWFIRNGVIYGCKRYELAPDGGRGPIMTIKGRATLQKTQHAQNWFVCQGYFQMFRWHRGMRFGSYPAADAYDDDFAHDFALSAEMPDFYVLHQGDMSTTHVNWAGRKTARVIA